MRVRNPLITAAILSLALTGPAAFALAHGPSAGVHDQNKDKEKDKDKDKNRNRDRRNDDRRGGEDLTQMRFAGMDVNHDGRITRDEWRGNDNSFARHDWNGDGVLSGPEVTPGAQPPNGHRGGGDDGDDDGDRFDRLDRNNDGRLSLAEWQGPRDLFERLDLNRDGFLTRDELRQHRGDGGDRLDRFFRTADANGDGRLSRSEWPGDLARFDRLDRNHDGFLTRDELGR
jgi:hypothetical protein